MRAGKQAGRAARCESGSGTPQKLRAAGATGPPLRCGPDISCLRTCAPKASAKAPGPWRRAADGFGVALMAGLHARSVNEPGKSSLTAKSAKSAEKQWVLHPPATLEGGHSCPRLPHRCGWADKNVRNCSGGGVTGRWEAVLLGSQFSLTPRAQGTRPEQLLGGRGLEPGPGLPVGARRRQRLRR